MTARLLIIALAFATPLGAADDDAQLHWAFQAISDPAVPKVEDSEWGKNSIDAFVLAQLEQAKLKPSAEASPHTLLRRLHLDLTGLLPTLEEISAFEVAWQVDPENAYAEKVDALLASPHFGERWARHWLDLARYADSDGYLGDTLRIWAWLYRDWVIDAINADQPFDRFSIEQLAGDLLPDASESQKIAAGFHRNNLKNTEAGADRELDRTKQVVDRVATTGTTWLGLTLACAECHDHKHDPISQQEFYQLYAFFNNSKDADITVDVDTRRWTAPESPPVKEGASDAEKKKSQDEHKKKATPKAQTLVELGSKDHRETFIHIRGNYADAGETVSPAMPAVLHPFAPGEKRRADRLALAEWLFEESNPLTARVAVNRIWQQLFGAGLVTTSEDFGTHGSPPSHPELLDWLASEYRRLGWSRKHLIRTIVLSASYRQSSDNTHPERPNQLLWRQNAFRASAETVRDLHLGASGLLDTKIGGPSIYPPLPEFVTAVGRSVKWPTSEGSDRYRRGLYIFLKRTVLYPMLTVFDAPDTSVPCSRRESTNTPMQALTLLNDPVFFECAEVLGADLHAKHATDTAAAIHELVRYCLNRPATAAEISTLSAAHHDFARSTGDAEKAMIATARVVMNLDEFITRE